MLFDTIFEKQKNVQKKFLSLLPPLPTDRTPLDIIISHFPEDVSIALALKNLYDVPLGTYILDDRNVYGARAIPDAPLKDLIQKSDLCFGVSPDLYKVYQSKFERSFWWLPPVVEPSAIVDEPVAMAVENLDRSPGILIGNIWSQKWLDRLRSLLRETGYRIEWYGNPNQKWLIFDEEQIYQDGLSYQNFIPQSELISKLQNTPYTIIPTSATEDPDDRPEMSLSFPSRLIFIIASSNTPAIVIGSRDSVAARFVEYFQIGLACDYTPDSFREAVNKICSPSLQVEMRRRAAELAKYFSSEGIDEWI